MVGIDSVYYGGDRRDLYARFAPLLLKSGKLDLISSRDQVLGLGELPEAADKMLKGQIRGRYVVDTSK